MRWLDSITNSVDMNLSKLWERVEDRGAWHATVHEVTKSWTQLSNNNNLIYMKPDPFLGAGDTAENKIKFLPSWSLYSSRKGTINK